MFHKHRDVVVARQDERGRRTVFDCLPKWVMQDGWVPVVRLDCESQGLLLFTQAGAIVELLTRPHHFLKTYQVWVTGSHRTFQSRKAIDRSLTSISRYKKKLVHKN